MAAGINGNSRAGIPTPSFDADFALSETLDPRITFSRASNATRVNSQGLIEYAPHNLLTFSEQFDNAAWTKTTTTVTANSFAAPNGTTTADTLTATGANSTTLGSLTTTANDHTFSVWLRRRTGTGTVEITAHSGGTWVAQTITSDWARYSVTQTLTAGTRTPGIRIVDSGDAVDVRGAQLNVGALQPYYPTTVKNLLGFSESFENAAWTKSNSYIQTNLLTWSEQFDNAAWTKGNSSITANTTIAPNGTLTGDKVVEDTANNTHRVAATNISVTSGASYTLSLFAKAAERSAILLSFGADNSAFPLTQALFSLTGAGSFTNISGTPNAVITNVGNGWYRCSITATASSTTSSGIIRFFVSSGTTSGSETYTGDGVSGLFIWGAQLVQGSTAGDYQQTLSAATPVMYKAPNGTMTADKLVENTAAAQHVLRGQSISYLLGTTYVFSVYAKAAERSRVQLTSYNGVSDVSTLFDLSNGTVVSGSGTITDVGNGWYRLSNTFAITSAHTTVFGAQVYIVSGTSLTNYTGDGTSGIYIWGAQLSDSASLDTYVATPGAAPTSTAYYGPRFTYDPVTKAPLGLLIEEQRTNLCLQSEDLGTSWINVNSSEILNTLISPAGTLTADKLVEDTAAGEHYINSASVTWAGNTQYTASVYLKAGERTRAQLQYGTGGNWVNGERTANFDLSAGTVVTSPGSPATASITSVGNGWYRCALTATTVASPSASGLLVKTIQSGTTTSYTGDGTSGIYIWGAQLEAGAKESSYIPTTTASATRSADVSNVTGSNFASWYRQDEGTLFAAYQGSEGAASRRILSLNDSTVNNIINSIASNGSGTASNYFEITTGGSLQAQLGASGSYTSTSQTSAGSYKVNDIAFSKNGAAALTDTTALIPVVNRLEIGVANSSFYLNGTIKRIAYYPTRLSNQQLQSLTS